jgi:hypothetical protein
VLLIIALHWCLNVGAVAALEKGTARHPIHTGAEVMQAGQGHIVRQRRTARKWVTEWETEASKDIGREKIKRQIEG